MMTQKKYKRTTHIRRLPTFPGIWGALGLAHGPKERNWRSMSSCHCCSFCFCFILKIDFRIFFQIDDNDAAAIGAGRFSTRGAQNRSFPQKQTRGSGFPSRPRKFIGFPDDHAVKDTSSDPPRLTALVSPSALLLLSCLVLIPSRFAVSLSLTCLPSFRCAR